MEYLLFGVIIVLLIERFLTNRAHAQEREQLIKAVMAKDVVEYSAVSQGVDEDAPMATEPDYTPIEEVDNHKFMKAIQHGSEEDSE